MTREEKSIAIEDLTAQLAGTNIYIADISGLKCRYYFKIEKSLFKAGIKLEVVKILYLKQWKLLIMIMVIYHRY
jgi:large subunit ribosomal protein L10